MPSVFAADAVVPVTLEVAVDRASLVPLSGGWDSAYCLVSALRAQTSSSVVAVFADYGQPYIGAERTASALVARCLGVELTTLKMKALPCDAGVFKDRNRTIITAALLAAVADVRRVYFGCRNPFAALDRYGDSNRQWARQLGKELGVEMRTPCVLLPKWEIRRRVVAAGVSPESVFSTEGISIRGGTYT